MKKEKTLKKNIYYNRIIDWFVEMRFLLNYISFQLMVIYDKLVTTLEKLFALLDWKLEDYPKLSYM